MSLRISEGRPAKSKSAVTTLGMDKPNAPDVHQHYPLAQIVDLMPKCGLPQTNYQRVRWWVRQGCRARDGVVVRLRHVRVGRVMHATLADVREFFDELARHDTAYFDAKRSARGRKPDADSPTSCRSATGRHGNNDRRADSVPAKPKPRKRRKTRADLGL